MEQPFYHIFRFIRDNHYSITSDEFTRQLTSHPDYPSLYAISDSLSHWEIENMVVKIPVTEFSKLPEIFIAVTGMEGHYDILYVKKVAGDKVMVYEGKQKREMEANHFLKIWSGIVLVAESASKESRSAWQLGTGLSKALLILMMVMFFLRLISGGYTFSTLLFLLLSMAGMFLSVLAVRETLGFFSGAVHKICNAGSKTSCGEVLSSPGARIFGKISLSDLCLVYFTALIWTLLAAPGVCNDLWFFIVHLAGVLFAFYSVYYQAFVLKKWCVICLGIGLVTCLQFGILLLFSDYTPVYQFFPVFMISISLIALGWLWWKEQLIRLKDLRVAEIELLTLKRNRKVFKALLEEGEQVDETGLSKIPSMGPTRSLAGEVIYEVLSPSCVYCKKAYQSYYDLMQKMKGGDAVGFRLVFNVNPDNEQNPYLEVCYKVFEIYEKEGGEQAWKALHRWYTSDFSLEVWYGWYGRTAQEHVPRYKQYLYAQYNWCKENNINHTPATIFRGYLCPLSFSISDLRLFMEDA
ncbi:Uncharacterized membrane protein [Sinomicrobium oceani]|uniref:Uncharacterized membrane protein n=1 Tax=Sinomicrobium oceani TaxID=1150368 RepID=A0A1K1RXS7_9FLAO|nr:vitamin K epoxide reductase family protein [Sinomicrobium oceani]SFW76762.1 Uncharacterized membrane protein [Sinomicrobium oceani]